MMSREQHLLDKVAEECAEVGQRALKAAIFGIEDMQPGQALGNRERMENEFVDLLAVAIMASRRGLIAHPAHLLRRVDQITNKIEKVERYMAYAVEKGTLEP